MILSGDFAILPPSIVEPGVKVVSGDFEIGNPARRGRTRRIDDSFAILPPFPSLVLVWDGTDFVTRPVKVFIDEIFIDA